MSFGEELLQRRKEIDLTQRGLENRTGISDSMIAKYEKSESCDFMSMKHAKILSSFFGWSLDEMGKYIKIKEWRKGGK